MAFAVSLDVEPVARALAVARRDPDAMKTSTMTFAVFVDSDQIAGWVEERARALADKHPSRVLIFDARQAQEDHRIAPSERRGEWVQIGVRDASAAELEAALTMLELPAAPVVLLWAAGDVARDGRFLSLARLAGATICSSSLTRTDGEGLRDLTLFVEEHPEIALQDISYLRLASWQELIAEFFDDPARRTDLQALQSIEVGAGSDAEMYYLLGWLASRLGWTPQTQTHFASPTGMVEFSMRREGPPRRLSRIVLSTANARYTAAVHRDDQETICLVVEDASGKSERCAPLVGVDLASLVERAILNTARDDIFIESMTMARHILERQAA
jgi:glucose-6-phosphate dehydrogenase assembly protein OpcA